MELNGLLGIQLVEGRHVTLTIQLKLDALQSQGSLDLELNLALHSQPAEAGGGGAEGKRAKS